jgi:hypothetical protein
MPTTRRIAVAEGINDLNLIELVLEVENSVGRPRAVGADDDVLGAMHQIDFERDFGFDVAIIQQCALRFADDNVGVRVRSREVGNIDAVDDSALVEGINLFPDA